MQFLKPSILTLLLLTLLAGCGTSSKKSKSSSNPGMNVSYSDLKVNADSDSMEAGALKTVYFPFNSSDLRERSRLHLDNNVEFLKKFDKLKIQIEGHCDERGSVQYNLALGEKRSKAVKNYLIASGIESNRITTVSFERTSISLEHSENSWAKNRQETLLLSLNSYF